MTYLITFACYGCHLYGEGRGSVDRNHNLLGSRVVEADTKRLAAEKFQWAKRRKAWTKIGGGRYSSL